MHSLKLLPFLPYLKLLYFPLSSLGDYLWKLIHALTFTTWALLCHCPWGRENYRYAKKNKIGICCQIFLNWVAWIFTKTAMWQYLGMKSDCHTFFFSPSTLNSHRKESRQVHWGSISLHMFPYCGWWLNRTVGPSYDWSRAAERFRLNLYDFT